MKDWLRGSGMMHTRRYRRIQLCVDIPSSIAQSQAHSQHSFRVAFVGVEGLMLAKVAASRSPLIAIRRKGQCLWAVECHNPLYIRTVDWDSIIIIFRCFS